MCSRVSHLPAELFYCLLKLENNKKILTDDDDVYTLMPQMKPSGVLLLIWVQVRNSVALRVRFTFLHQFFSDPDFVWTSHETFTSFFVGKKKEDVVEEDYDDDNPCARCFSNVRPDSVSSCSLFIPSLLE